MSMVPSKAMFSSFEPHSVPLEQSRSVACLRGAAWHYGFGPVGSVVDDGIQNADFDCRISAGAEFAEFRICSCDPWI
ncbi:hypothetical protein Nepgr_013651 [Nepenthes gracilis]|uniref:Uncharacterized protein n=1 Tax=Nepenthes gracilis TaxID=150966 RepID=A0AAD3SHV4_NEPGR|nr:hypothetical protein Nepgr_013651 [Nepenthes gracilis]